MCVCWVKYSSDFYQHSYKWHLWRATMRCAVAGAVADRATQLQIRTVTSTATTTVIVAIQRIYIHICIYISLLYRIEGPEDS